MRAGEGMEPIWGKKSHVVLLYERAGACEMGLWFWV